MHESRASMTGAAASPNLFIVGAPKCGTSSMANYLSQHPDVYMARRELHYFGSDLFYSEEFPFGQTRGDLEKYLSHFINSESFKIRGEKSVYYLHSKKAATEISEFSSDARIIIMLRNPVDFIFSHHSQLRFSGDEPIADVHLALAAEPQRENGHNIPKRIDIVSKLYYRTLADFAPSVQRYFDVFGRDQVLVVLLDEISHDPVTMYRKTTSFLGINSSFTPIFRQINPRKVVRYKMISELVRHPPSLVRYTARILVPTTALRDRLGRVILRRVNARKIDAGFVNSELRRDLMAEFEPAIVSLSELIGRDLSHWAARVPPKE